jgi:hypothetical protein
MGIIGGGIQALQPGKASGLASYPTKEEETDSIRL